MVTIITITPNYTYLYLVISLVSLYLIIIYQKQFSQESLIDYLIYLTMKIVLFVSFFSFLLIFLVMILNGSQTNTDYFLNNLANNVLTYLLFNLGLFYLIVFIDWVKEMFIKNDLYSYSLIKKGQDKK